MRTCFSFFLSFIKFSCSSSNMSSQEVPSNQEDNGREQVRLGQEQEDEAIPSNHGEAETGTPTVHNNIMPTVLPPRPSNLNDTPWRLLRCTRLGNGRRHNGDGVRSIYGNNNRVESSTVGQQQETISSNRDHEANSSPRNTSNDGSMSRAPAEVVENDENPSDRNSSSTGNGGGGDVDREGYRIQQLTTMSYSSQSILELENMVMRLRELAREDGGPKARHASKEAIEILEVVKIDGGGSNTPTTVCAVCLDEIPVGSEAKKMPCKHVYHGDCIVNWLNNSNVCPMCRFELPLA